MVLNIILFLSFSLFLSLAANRRGEEREGERAGKDGETRGHHYQEEGI